VLLTVSPYLTSADAVVFYSDIVHSLSYLCEFSSSKRNI